ncbi:4-oxalocrotonate tautomerase [Paraburkholderia dipogonis]|uniref:4-oxalocrotonate tautomerase n=1 Tax=Paraburkholderia dipogonis TaxID=1211383 RepID=A0A4Y8MX30_9BURK|nr:tautomerase family protein [Paraburkholderia dipogonis]TFE41908.1 4-oxalocrotonate tautomerase [Paraburkholderia dipogonis]
MPLWKVYTPPNAYTSAEREDIAKRITSAYAQIPIPAFYVVVIFREIPENSYFVGGEPHGKFIRFEVDHIARTLPGPILREWWVRTLDKLLAEYLRPRGFDWEFSYDETPFDLWSLQGEIPPPFESIAEKRWVKENKASSYTLDEKIPAGHFVLSPGVHQHE